jgi:hypothetical protein
MLFEEIIPHLNKMASLYLVNNKRRVGYLFADTTGDEEKGSREVVYFLTVMKSRKLMTLLEQHDIERIGKLSEEIQVSDIVRIRSIDG